MNFFERYLGFSGGRGDGSLEMLFLVVLSMIIVVAVVVFFPASPMNIQALRKAGLPE
jgi:hypothetical protein